MTTVQQTSTRVAPARRHGSARRTFSLQLSLDGGCAKVGSRCRLPYGSQSSVPASALPGGSGSVVVSASTPSDEASASGAAAASGAQLGLSELGPALPSSAGAAPLSTPASVHPRLLTRPAPTAEHARSRHAAAVLVATGTERGAMEGIKKPARLPRPRSW